jgi:hypothetical protein
VFALFTSSRSVIRCVEPGLPWLVHTLQPSLPTDVPP